MAKKKYVKPVMTSEAFVTDSYCAVCTDITGSKLVAKCGDCPSIIFEIGSPSAETGTGTVLRYNALAFRKSDNAQVGSGLILRVNDNLWIADISLNDGCHAQPTGEFQYTNDPSLLETTASGITYCDHAAITNGRHHHLTQETFINKNQS